MEEIKYLKTPRGEFKIVMEFLDMQQAELEGFSLYFTHKDKNIVVKSKGKEGSFYFATVPVQQFY